jgi:thiosulfate/3-mercaptopyruvate sulfurtransferase
LINVGMDDESTLTEPSMLIKVDSLSRQLAGFGGAAPAAPPTVLDVRWGLGGPPGIESFRRGHLPSAVFVDLDRDLSGVPGEAGRHPLPSAPDFQAVMRRAGVTAGWPVVVYDDGDSMAAARAWWVLRYFGHEQVQVLDGGYRAWVTARWPVTGEVFPVAPGDFTATAGHMPLLDADGAAAAARAGLLLDARAGERYRGETEPVDPVAGHIPGAVSAPTAENVRADGSFKTPAELRDRFAALCGAAAWPTTGQTTPAPADAAPADAAPDRGEGASSVAGAVGVYCGSGVTAAHEVLSLVLAGVPAALYVGSWSNWVADSSRPVATGPGPG